MQRRFTQRPSPLEIRSSHPGVYASLSEEAKRSIPSTEGTAMLKVYVSFAEATAENLLVSGRVGESGACDVDFGRAVQQVV